MIDDKVKETIENLSDYEAKTMLKLIYGFVVTALTGNGGNEMIKECVNGIANCYNRMIEVKSKDVE